MSLAKAENDADAVGAVDADLDKLDDYLKGLEFKRMFSGELDQNNAFLDIQSAPR